MRRILGILLSPVLILGLAPAAGSQEPDPNARADLAVSYDGPQGVLVGDRITGTFTVSNLGPDQAESANLTVSVPPGLDEIVTTPSNPAIDCTWNEYQYALPPEA